MGDVEYSFTTLVFTCYFVFEVYFILECAEKLCIFKLKF